MAIDLGLAVGQGAAGLASGLGGGIQTGRQLATRGSQAEAAGLQFAINALLGREREAHRTEFELAKERLKQEGAAKDDLKAAFQVAKPLETTLTQLARENNEDSQVVNSGNPTVTPEQRAAAQARIDTRTRRIQGIEMAIPHAKRIEDKYRSLVSENPEAAREYLNTAGTLFDAPDGTYTTDDFENFMRTKGSSPRLGKTGKELFNESVNFYGSLGYIRTKDRSSARTPLLQTLKKVETATKGKTFQSEKGAVDINQFIDTVIPILTPAIQNSIHENLGNPTGIASAKTDVTISVIKNLRETNFGSKSFGAQRIAFESQVRDAIDNLFQQAEEGLKMERPLNQEPIAPGAPQSALPPGMLPPEAGALPGTAAAPGFQAGLPQGAPAGFPGPALPPAAPPAPRGPDLRLAQSPRVRTMVSRLTQGMFVPVEEQNLLAEMVAGVFDEGDLNGVT